MNSKKFLIVSGIITVLFVMVILVSFFGKNQSILTPFPTPTLAPFFSSDQQPKEFQLTLPAKNYLQSLSVGTPLKIEFSEPIKKEGVVYEITPLTTIQYFVSKDGKILTIIPSSFWIPNANYVFVLKEVESQEGKIKKINSELRFSVKNTSDEENASSAEVNNKP